MEILRKIKSEFDNLSRRGKALVIMGFALSIIIIIELVR